MGNYTEILIKAKIKSCIPDNVRNILMHLFDSKIEFEDEYIKSILPEHEFFKCPRWHLVGTCCSSYHIPWIDSNYEDGYIFSRSDLKDYDDEIDKFFDWISDYIDGIPGQCIGYKWHEYDDAPTLAYLKGIRVEKDILLLVTEEGV